MHLDDPRMDPLLAKCAELRMPVNIHVADPYWMYLPMDAANDGLMNAYKWRLDNQPGIVGHEGMVKILEGAVKRHPKTIFVACHFYAYDHFGYHWPLYGFGLEDRVLRKVYRLNAMKIIGGQTSAAATLNCRTSGAK